MSSELTVFLLLAAAVLLAAAMLGGRIFSGSWVRSLPGTMARILVGGAGAVLGVWVLWSLYVATYPTSQEAPSQVAAVAPATPPRGDPVPTAITALQDCVVASPPPVPPDGKKASEEEMLAARTAFQQYDAATNSYVKCVDLTIAHITQQFPTASPTDLRTLRTLGDGAHNTAIDQEQALADQLNAQVRAFKATHPGS
jgi:hypothetical protein